MQIRIIRKYDTPQRILRVGEEFDERDDSALELIEAGFAEAVEAQPLQTDVKPETRTAIKRKGRPRKSKAKTTVTTFDELLDVPSDEPISGDLTNIVSESLQSEDG